VTEMRHRLAQSVNKNIVVGLLVLLTVVLFLVHRFVHDFGAFPAAWNLGLRPVIDDFKEWVIVARSREPIHPMFSLFFNPLSDGIEEVLGFMENFLIETPWLVIILAIFFIALRITNLRMALFISICVVSMGLLGLWEESMETLALMLLSVLVSLLIGIPLGILSAKNDTVERVLRPILDAMQTMPAFVYLIPVLLFFGIGGTPALIATVIYAIPPSVRLTNLGIRNLPKNALEAAESFGSTPLQTLFKVEIPMAMPSIMSGVNQTIMMALGIVVIASLIGFAGLGDVVLKSLRRLRVGQAFEAGLAIVFLAILLDRISYALSQYERSSERRFQGNYLLPEQSWLVKAFQIKSARRLGMVVGYGVLFYVFIGATQTWIWNDISTIWRSILLLPLLMLGLHFVEPPIEKGIAIIYRAAAFVEQGVVRILSLIPVQRWQEFVLSSGYWLTALLSLILINFVCVQIGEIKLNDNEDDPTIFSLVEFPEDLQIQIRQPIDDGVAWMQVNLYDINDSGIGTGPFSDFLTLKFMLPLRNLLQDTLSWIVIILIFMTLAYAVDGWRLAFLTLLAMMLIGGLGMWEHAMDTLSQVIMAVALSILIGIPLGVWSALNDLAERMLRPLLDFLQTIPPFVYLVPVIMLFTLGRIPGIIASVLYALPPLVRLTNLGIRQVEETMIEVADAFGSTGWQKLYKVQLPLALPTIMLGINQTIMMVLSMVIIAGLVGGGGLGFEVVAGLSQNELGRGVESGLAIVLMAIILDRITQAFAELQARRAHIITAGGNPPM
jgi:glycine betaine/proline transport system permease protein